MIQLHCDDITGEFKVFSIKTGEVVFDAIIKDQTLQRKIVEAIRKSEMIATNHTKMKAIQHLEVM